MEELMKFERYEDFKQVFDWEYRSQAEGYIRMGYLLKIARDTDILHESGYKSIAEFAWNEYKLRDDAVSRMIDVNDRFSEGGYSDRLDEKYKGYGASLLAEMITMSDAVIDALPDGTTREMIRVVKKEIREENKITDLEVMIEEEDKRQRDMDSNLAKMLHQYYRDNCREYPTMHKAITAPEGDEIEAAAHSIAPSGVGVRFARVKGMGKFMLSAKGWDQDLELLNVRQNQSESYTWETCLEALRGLCPQTNMKESWEEVYGEPYPEEKKEVAPAQVKTADAKPSVQVKPEPKPETKPEPRTEPKSEPKLELQEPAPDNQQPEEGPEEETVQQENTDLGSGTTETDNEAPDQEASGPEGEQEEDDPEEPMEGDKGQGAQVNTEQEPIQVKIEDYPEVLPKNYIKCHDGTEVEETDEHRMWKEAAEWSERLFHTFELGSWPIEQKVLEEMRSTASNLLDAINKLVEHVR